MLRGQNYTDMPKFKLITQATFEGTFIINANNKDEAQSIFDKECAMGMLRDPRSDSDNVTDFMVNMHPSAEVILSITQLPKK